MANNYFQFKAFEVQQEFCAMKVSTDACIQGAWTPVCEDVITVLDIGCGTGLLALMLAQRFDKINITAIDIDIAAAQQAKENCLASPWHDRIKVLHGDVKNYPFAQQFDMIICNPPFFQNNLKNNEANRSLARHDVALSLPNLFEMMVTHLAPNGVASILLPIAEQERWAKLLSDNGWHFVEQLNVLPRATKPANRIISLCARRDSETKVQTIAIKNEYNNDYTQAFIQLMQPFYLNL